MNLAANHAEWFYQLADYGPDYRIYQTWKPSHRIRFRWGRNKPVEMGWYVIGGFELQDERAEALALVGADELFRAMYRSEVWPTFRLFGCDELTNPPAHFDKDGNEIQRREK